MNDLRSVVFGLIARELAAGGVEADACAIDESSDLYADLGADELDVITIVMAAEQACGVHLSDDLCDGLRTAGDLLAAVRIAQAQRAEAG